MSKKTPLETTRDEIMRTIIDMSKVVPGLQASVLITAPDPDNPRNAQASFFATHDAEKAVKIMLDILRVGTSEQIDLPEAS